MYLPINQVIREEISQTWVLPPFDVSFQASVSLSQYKLKRRLTVQ